MYNQEPVLPVLVVYQSRWKFGKAIACHAEQREASHFAMQDEILRCLFADS